MQWFLNEEQASEHSTETICDASYFDRYPEPSELLCEEADPMCGQPLLDRLAALRALM